MPEIPKKKKEPKDKAAPTHKRSEVVSAYSEEGAQRNFSRLRREKIIRIVAISLFFLTIIAAIVLFFALSGIV